MPYDHDVFLSYRRHGEWPQWVRNTFAPMFRHWLGEELDDVKIFIDENLEAGKSWPQELGRALGNSKIIVPLFSRQYFSSPWCQRELAHMFAREAAVEFRTQKQPAGLIVPAHIHGHQFPKRAQAIQAAQLQLYTNPWVAKGSVTEERLAEKIREWTPQIAAAIRSAPPHNDSWTTIAIEEFMREFAEVETKQTVPPSLG
ncbi:MAG TPA: toll/interleukin-1 receptor domain-containing protein [Candidatus Angelobacter sp.]|nr:toll/interleukin-1 receptor domain-containing protein [Candidatus Angelobacter sp.]